jgi:hypothetical protein
MKEHSMYSVFNAMQMDPPIDDHIEDYNKHSTKSWLYLHDEHETGRKLLLDVDTLDKVVAEFEEEMGQQQHRGLIGLRH